MILGAVVAGGAVLACTGGGGALPGEQSMWESSPSTRERAQNSRESAPSSTERASTTQEGTGGTSAEPTAQNGGGSGGLDCTGTYTCQEVGDDDRDTIALSSVNGACVIVASKSTTFTLAADGTLLVNGQAGGSWARTSNGFTATTAAGTIVCTKGTSVQTGTGDGTTGKPAAPADAGVKK
jgi:hypothetical protein